MKFFGYNICSPALIYLVFSMTQVVVDSIKGLYNVALLKFIMLVLFTMLLNILCQRGLGLVSWIIVFVPFILMSVITSILLFVFGLDPSSGAIMYPVQGRPAPRPTAVVLNRSPQTEADIAEVRSHDLRDNEEGQFIKDKLELQAIEGDERYDYGKSTQNRIDHAQDVDRAESEIRDKIITRHENNAREAITARELLKRSRQKMRELDDLQ